MGYHAVGLDASSLLEENVEGYSRGSGVDPISWILQSIQEAGMSIDNALTNPKVQEFMRQTGVKVQELQAEEKRREQKRNILLWGGGAVLVVFLLFRKKQS